MFAKDNSRGWLTEQSITHLATGLIFQVIFSQLTVTQLTERCVQVYVWSADAAASE